MLFMFVACLMANEEEDFLDVSEIEEIETEEMLGCKRKHNKGNEMKKKLIF